MPITLIKGYALYAKNPKREHAGLRFDGGLLKGGKFHLRTDERLEAALSVCKAFVSGAKDLAKVISNSEYTDYLQNGARFIRYCDKLAVTHPRANEVRASFRSELILFYRASNQTQHEAREILRYLTLYRPQFWDHHELYERLYLIESTLSSLQERMSARGVIEACFRNRRPLALYHSDNLFRVHKGEKTAVGEKKLPMRRGFIDFDEKIGLDNKFLAGFDCWFLLDHQSTYCGKNAADLTNVRRLSLGLSQRHSAIVRHFLLNSDLETGVSPPVIGRLIKVREGDSTEDVVKSALSNLRHRLRETTEFDVLLPGTKRQSPRINPEIKILLILTKPINAPVPVRYDS